MIVRFKKENSMVDKHTSQVAKGLLYSKIELKTKVWQIWYMHGFYSEYEGHHNLCLIIVELVVGYSRQVLLAGSCQWLISKVYHECLAFVT